MTKITWAGITGTPEDVPGGQISPGSQTAGAAGDTTTSPSHNVRGAHVESAGGGPAAQPAKPVAAPSDPSRAGRTTSRGQTPHGTHASRAPAARPPAGHDSAGPPDSGACGDTRPPPPRQDTHATGQGDTVGGLADPLLAFAADILSDLEKVRIANENRLRQLTRDVEDADGELRGFGLDTSHPDVARVAALVDMLGAAEHQAELNLGRRMRTHPLYPWVQRSKGVGVKQAARLLAAIGDPYMRPEITTGDGETEPARPRKVSELWAFTGYHVIKVPAGSQVSDGTHAVIAAGGEDTRTSQTRSAAHGPDAGAGQTATPANVRADTQSPIAGVAPRRQRGVRANWSGTAKMRAFLVAESCIKQLDGGYRAVYDAARVKYADAVHEVACVRCGPRGAPAQPGSPLSDGHKHGRGLRAVAKAVLKDLWREARNVHDVQDSTSSQSTPGTQMESAAGEGPVTGGQTSRSAHCGSAAGDPTSATSSHAGHGTHNKPAAGGGGPVTGSQSVTGAHVAVAAGDHQSAASSHPSSGTQIACAAGSPPSATGGQSAHGTHCRAAAGGGPSASTSQGAE